MDPAAMTQALVTEVNYIWWRTSLKYLKQTNHIYIWLILDVQCPITRLINQDFNKGDYKNIDGI